MTPGERLEALRGRIDLARVPFTDRLSRLLLFRAEDGLWLTRALYEIPAADAIVLRRLRFTANGDVLPVEISARPDRVDIETPIGRATIVFVDPETLLIDLPTGNLEAHRTGVPTPGIRTKSEQHISPRSAGSGISFAVTAEEIDASEQGRRARIAGATPCWLSWAGEAQAKVRAGTDGWATVEIAATAEQSGPIVLRVSTTQPEPFAVPDARSTIAAATHRWEAWLSKATEVADPLRPMADYAWWVLRSNQIFPLSDPRRPGVAPSKQGYVAIWNWDSCFHALGLRLGDPEAAKDQLRIILAHQLADGMLPDVVHDGGTIAFTTDLPPHERGFGLPAGWDPATPIPITKPPLMAWAARAIWESDGDKAFLREVYDAIAHNLAWWLATADANGLYAYNHAYSSGLDDSPIWDGGPPVTSPELSAYLAFQCDEMAVIAAAIGRRQDSASWREHAAEITERLVAGLWDERRGLFANTRHGELIPVDTPFGLMPLLTGRLPQRIAGRLVQTLTDPRRFWATYPVPTVALNDPAFDPQRMWRGPVWLNVNRLLVEGLARSGFAKEAAALRRKTLALALANADFAEYYDPLTGTPPPRAAPAFGWAAASFLDLAAAGSSELRSGDGSWATDRRRR